MERSSSEVYRWWSQRTPAIVPAFPPALHTHEPAGSSPEGQTVSPAGPLNCSGFHIPAGYIQLITHTWEVKVAEYINNSLHS